MKEQKSRGQKLLLPALLLGALLLLGLLFVPECDDCYFVFWRFASWKDFLLTRPVTEGVRVVGVPANGRYLGNLLGVLQGKLYFTPAGFLRGLFMGGALVGLVLLLSRWFTPENGRRREGLLAAFALVALAPRGIWQQVYSWGAGLVNYLLPMAGILLLMALVRRGRRWAAACFLLSMACCWFMEPVTILLFIGSAVFALFAFLREKEALPCGAAGFAGALLGAGLMFLNPGYRQIGGDTRSMGLSLIGHNIKVIAAEALVRPVAVTLLISVLLVWLFRKAGGRWKPYAGALLVIHLLCLGDGLVDLTRTAGRSTLFHLALGGALALVWLVLLIQWKGGETRRQVWAGVLALCVANGPLLVVSPVDARNFFPSYVILLLIASRLWLAAGKEGFPRLERLWIPGAAACLLLLFVYGSNCAVYHQRLESAHAQVEQGAQELNLPLVPFAGWAANEQVGKGDISYLVYRETPWDVSFQFTPYGEWKK